MNARGWAWGATVLALLASCAAYAWLTPSFDSSGGPRVLCFFLIGCLGFLAVWLQPSASARWKGVLIFWVPVVFARLCLLPSAPSDDINRYLWEGKLLAEGLSPYAHTADATEWEAHRDVYWEAMNHKDKPTAYPPMVLGAFALVGWLWYHPLAFKCFFVLADLLTVGAILRLLTQRGLSPAYAGFYALNPVVLVSFAGEGHFDALMIAALAWALVPSGPWLRALLLGLSAGVKWVTLPLVPFVVGGEGGRRFEPGPFLLAVGALSIPFLAFRSTLSQIFAGLFEFGTSRSFNGPVYSLLHEALSLPRGAVLSWIAGAFLLLLCWRWWIRGKVSLDAQIRWLLGGIVVLSPTVHFWYLAWLLPFVCLRPSLPWLLLSLSSSAYFFVWTNQTENGFWGLQDWQVIVFWGPFGLGLLYELWSTRALVFRGPSLSRIESPKIGVVIPTLNAASSLETAVRSVNEQTEPVDAVLVVDGGSQDGTPELAESWGEGLELVRSRPGRGDQIAKGLELIDADWVVVLHADGTLAPDSVRVLKRAIQAHPQAVAGAFGQRFRRARPELLLIEVLNDLRGLFSRTAFGDQIQFFRRDVALRRGLMPAQPLMEDVESSWRARTCGEFLFLNHPGSVDHGKWERRFWWRRFRLVCGLMVRYRWGRRRGPAYASDLSERLYRDYYGSLPSATARAKSSAVSTS